MPARGSNFVEECLRMESPIKGSVRLALRDARVADVDVPAGSILMLMNAVIPGVEALPRGYRRRTRSRLSLCPGMRWGLVPSRRREKPSGREKSLNFIDIRRTR